MRLDRVFVRSKEPRRRFGLQGILVVEFVEYFLHFGIAMQQPGHVLFDSRTLSPENYARTIVILFAVIRGGEGGQRMCSISSSSCVAGRSGTADCS